MDPINPNHRREVQGIINSEDSSSNTGSSDEEQPFVDPINPPPIIPNVIPPQVLIRMGTPQELLGLIQGLTGTLQTLVQAQQNLQHEQQQMRADFAQIIDNTKEGMARALGNATFTVQLPEPPAGPQHAPPPRPPHITNTTFPRLDIGPKDDNISKFHQWETKVRFQYQANVSYTVIPFAAVASGILTSLVGSAESVATDMNAENFANMDALMDHLRTALCGGAVAEKAMVLFMSSKQNENEDITSFANRLENLWRRAYPQEADRSVSILIKQFLSGIREQFVSDQIIRREQGIPAAFAELRELAVQISSRNEIVKQNRLMHQQIKGKGTGSSHPPGGRALPMERKGGPEAMEVDAISSQKGRRDLKDPAKDRREAAKKNEFKGIPAGRSPKVTGYTPQGEKGQVKPNFQVGGKDKPPPYKEGPCFQCKGPHRVANCPEKRKGVGAIQETVVEDDDEDFVSAMEENIASIGFLNEQHAAQKPPFS